MRNLLGVVLISFLLLSSCASVQQFYEGEPKPKKEVAFLKSQNNKQYDSNGYTTKENITIREVNGKRVEFGWNKKIALTPGLYTVKVYYHRSTYLSENTNRALYSSSQTGSTALDIGLLLLKSGIASSIPKNIDAKPRFNGQEVRVKVAAGRTYYPKVVEYRINPTVTFNPYGYPIPAEPELNKNTLEVLVDGEWFDEYPTIWEASIEKK